jgi:hypothetical protein
VYSTEYLGTFNIQQVHIHRYIHLTSYHLLAFSPIPNIHHTPYTPLQRTHQSHLTSPKLRSSIRKTLLIEMTLSNPAALALILSLTMPFSLLLFGFFLYIYILPAHRISQHRISRHRDLESGAGSIEIFASEGGIDRAGEVHLAMRAMREEQWRRDRAVDGRSVGNRQAEILPESAEKGSEKDGLV